jgi:hypothetical protein
MEQIGRTKHALPLYRFRYKGSDEEYSGVMAQDVLEVMPEAVSVGADGFYRVNDRMLGIELVRLEDGLFTSTDGGEARKARAAPPPISVSRIRLNRSARLEIDIVRRD